MGNKLAWTGLAIILVTPVFGVIGGGYRDNIFIIIGAIMLSFGVLLNWFNK